MKKPHFGTSGQPMSNSSGKMGGNPAGGGAAGQPMGTKNKPMKQAVGTQGQRLAGPRGASAKGHRPR